MPVLTLALAMLAAPATAVPAAAQSVEAASTSAPLRPGDLIRLFFWREPDLSVEYPVDETGRVALPYLGYRDVGSIPASELKARLTEDYAQYLADQAVQIILLRRVTVLGAVRNPGIYHVDATMSAQDALALAGGVSAQGQPDALEVQRGGRVVDVEDGLAGGLASGDQLFVPERGWIERNGAVVFGAVISAVGFILGQALF